MDEYFEPVGGDEEPPAIMEKANVADYTVSDYFDAAIDIIPDEISPCSLVAGDGSTCTSPATVELIGKALLIDGTSAETIEEAKNRLNCADEQCVLTKLKSQLGEQRVRGELAINFKVTGPTDSRLLTNVHIDKVMQQWGHAYANFYPYNFNMRNYASYLYRDGRIYDKPDTLATIGFDALYRGDVGGRKYTCCGCVINSDKYQGDGKHWMALFADARGAKWTVEFFNSSGNPPLPEFANWMTKTKMMMEDIDSTRQVESIRVSSIRHQRSKSECGVYSLFYIWARLNGVPHEHFNRKAIDDAAMFEFRQHIFADPARRPLKKFDWDAYQKTTKIAWEAISTQD